MAVIEIKTINLGGIADSDMMGNKNSVAEMVGLDIHSKPGFIKVNQALTKDSGSFVDEFVRCGVACSDGNTYSFGSLTGKIWKRTGGGTWSLEATAAPSAGTAGIVDAMEYQGYIYYAMSNNLGRWQIGTSWASRDDNFATFTNNNASYHPMRTLNAVLYIGDGNLIAQVDTGVFSANALDLETMYVIQCLGQLGTDLLIGTIVNSNVVATQIFRWNTWSVSFTNSDPIPEAGINSFLPTDNFVIVNAGLKGNLYIYNGSTLDLYKQIKGNWDGLDTAFVYPNAVFNFGGLPLFGLSYGLGNPATLGIYSLARSNRNYPYVLNCEYLISTGEKQNIKIGAIISLGSQFLVSYQAANGTYGVDILDLTKKFNDAYLITRTLMPDRMKLNTFAQVMAGYRSLPTGCDIKFANSLNYGAFNDMTDVRTDIERKVKYSQDDIGDATVLQTKVTLETHENDAPELDLIHINIKNLRLARPSPDATNT